MTAQGIDEAVAAEAGDEPPETDKMVIIAASGDLDKAWPVMIWRRRAQPMACLSILKRPDSGITGEDWRQKMLRIFKKGSPGNLGLSTMNFSGMGAKMMKGLADDNNVASVQELLEVAQDMGVKLWPCQMTMDLMGLTNEDMIDGLDKPAGAGSAIALMKDASISLFV